MDIVQHLVTNKCIKLNFCFFSLQDVTRTSIPIVNLPIIYGLEPCAGQSIVNKKKIENDHASIETVMSKETNQNIGL